MMLSTAIRSCLLFISKRRVILPAVLFVALACSPGCRRFKKPSLAAQKELAQQSYTLRFTGYKQTVTVKATPEELSAFLSNVNNWFMVSGAEVGVGRQQAETNSLGAAGGSFEFSVRKMGIVISGRMIVVKATPEDLWLVWDNPQMVHVQRWKFEPVRGGTRLTLRMDTESPETMMTTMMEKTGFAEQVVKEVDFMLAGVQAHFDPSLDPRQLVAMGIRGDTYDSLWQVYDTSVWADATLKQVTKFNSSDRGRGEDAMMGFVVEEPCRDLNDVYYCGFSHDLFGRKIMYDSFTVGDLDKWLELNTYVIWLDYVSVLQSRATEEDGGVRLREIMLTEIPSGSGPNVMELMLAVAGVKDELAKSVMAIKAGVEKQGK